MANELERLRQFALAADALARAATDAEAVDEICVRLGVGRKRARSLINAVKQAWAELEETISAERLQQLRAQAIDQRRRLLAEVLALARNKSARDVSRVRAYEVALRYLDSIASLSGLAVQQHQHFVSGGLADAIAQLRGQEQQAKSVEAEVVDVKPELEDGRTDASSAEDLRGADG